MLSILLLLFLCSASFTSCIPLPSEESSQFSVTIGEVQTVQLDQFVTQNAKSDVPRVCDFEPMLPPIGQPYKYFLVNQSNSDITDGVACIAWVLHGPCGLTSWSKSEIRNLQDAMTEQLTKDGPFKETYVGAWYAEFPKFGSIIAGTSAFKDRNPTYFNLVAEAAMKTGRWQTFFYGRQYANGHIDVAQATNFRCR